MKKYGLTSASFTGEITYAFNDAGHLIYFNNEAELNASQSVWILKKMPLTIDELEMLTSTGKFKVVEIPFKVTFDMMWVRYNDFKRSSKKKSLVSWNKKTETDQVKAYLYYPTYNKERGSAEKKYLTTYLNDELWNN